MNLANRPPLGQKADRAAPRPDYLAAIHDLPCWICTSWGMPQTSPTQAHHPIHGRYGTRRTPDETAIPLCEGHHQGLRDTSKVALHKEPSKWKRLYGPDFDWIAPTQDRLRAVLEATA